MSEPMTEAGRRLLDAGNGEDAVMPDDWLGAILAIESEASVEGFRHESLSFSPNMAAKKAVIEPFRA